MSRGRILIAHNSRAARLVVRRRTLAEAPDFTIDEAASADDAAVRLRQSAFDVLICDEALSGTSDFDWLDYLNSQASHSRLGCIFLTSEATSPDQRTRLARVGKHAFLDARCTGEDIAAAIATVFDPRNRREHRRVCIPGTRALVRLGDAQLDVDVINIAVAGMLGEFTLPAEFGSIVFPSTVTLRFPTEFETEAIDGIQARVLRLQVRSRDSHHVPERLRAAWQYFHVPDDSRHRLGAVIELADEEAVPESRSLLGPSG